MRSKFTSRFIFMPKPGSRIFSTSLSHFEDLQKKTILDLAASLADEGKVRSSEDIYKLAIKRYPKEKEAYTALWESWARNRKLRVTKQEIEEFLAKYTENIKDSPQPLSRTLT